MFAINAVLLMEDARLDTPVYLQGGAIKNVALFFYYWRIFKILSLAHSADNLQ